MIFPVELIWLIPAVPFAASVVSTFLPAGAKKASASLAIGGMCVSLVLSVLALFQAMSNPVDRLTHNVAWFEMGDTVIPVGVMLEPLTAVMLVMVCFVGLMIFVFSLGYMREDARAGRFFCFLSFFAAAMLGIIVANSLLLLFVSWELVGLASYLLIGFWFEKPSAAAAAKKAFITTRIGDLGFLLGILWIQDKAGTLLFFDGGNGILEQGALQAMSVVLPCGLVLSTAVGLLVFCGAVGKSGQFPLHVWLPDAMEGPTPVSALIHAATMVAAGVFLVARIYPIMEADQFVLVELPFYALTVVAFVGAITALLGSLIAVAQNDIKRILAFSTVSQLGYMMLALGVGSWTAAIFHLLTHAFFKALLFLGAGSVIYAAHHEQDIRMMGGLGRRMKLTFATFSVGMMALAGVPFFFSGFWSKEAILHAAHGWQVSHLPFYIGMTSVVLTAFYMTRLMCEVFFGESRSEGAGHAHENSAVMTLPLTVLAIGSVLIGFLGTPALPWLQSFLTGEEGPAIGGGLFGEGAGLMWVSIALVGFGMGCGWWVYGKKLRLKAATADPIEKVFPGVWKALAGRLYFDEIYEATFGRVLKIAGGAADAADKYLIGGAVSLIAKIGLCAGLVQRENDETVINGGFDDVTKGIQRSGWLYSKGQSGEPQVSLRAIAAGFAVLVLIIFLGTRA